MTTSELMNNASRLHPVGYYILAVKLFHEGSKDESIFWFYVGSLRFRYYLSSIGDDPYHPENELFGKVQFEIGGLLLDYAGGDPESWSNQIIRSAEWDNNNSNIFFNKQRNPDALQEGHRSMRELAIKLIDEKDEIIRQRIENNAEVRV